MQKTYKKDEKSFKHYLKGAMKAPDNKNTSERKKHKNDTNPPTQFIGWNNLFEYPKSPVANKMGNINVCKEKNEIFGK